MRSREHVESVYALSPMQRGMLFHALYAPESDVHITQFDIVLRGDIEECALEAAWRTLVARHAILRTSFHWERVDAPVQIVWRQISPPLEQHDWRELPPSDAAQHVDQLLAAERARGFDLARPPAVRVALVRLPDHETRLVWTNHHIILDGWSTGLLARELFAAYDAAVSGRTLDASAATPFRTYITWLQEQDSSTALAYWRGALDGLAGPTHLAPRGYPARDAPASANSSQARGRLTMTPQHSAAASAFARRAGLTLSSLLHTAWALVCRQRMGMDDVVVGTVSAGRPAQVPGIETMVGLFINTLPLRVRIVSDEPATALVRRVQSAMVDMRTHEHLPLADLQQMTGLPAGVPLFDALFVFENYPVERTLDRISTSLQIERVHARERTSYPLTITSGPGEPLVLEAAYDRTVWREDEAQRLLQDLGAMLERVVANPDGAAGLLFDGFPSASTSISTLAPLALATSRGAGTAAPPHASISDTAFMTPLEEVVAAQWRSVLKCEHLRRRDDFFALGGHSLLATQLVSRLREAFGLPVPLRLAFDAPTIAAQAARIATMRQEGAELDAPPAPAPRRQVVGPMPLSFAQQRLWFLDRAAPDDPAYNMPRALRLRGDLDCRALTCALQAVVSRHEALRTRFGEVDGTPFQLIEPAVDLHVPIVDLRALEPPVRETLLRSFARREATRSFRLDRAPLLRVTLYALADQEHALLLSMHHIVSDGWSMGVLVHELRALYDASLSAGASGHGGFAPLPTLPLQYADFAVWQREWLTGDRLHPQVRYWRNALANLSALDLPLDHPRPPAQLSRGAAIGFVVPGPVRDAALALAARERCTLFMVLLAAWQVLLARYARQGDVCVGTPIANREAGSTEGLIGFFVNMLPLRAHLSDDPSFVEHLRRVRQHCLEAYAHQTLPFEKLVEELQPARDPRRHPLFQVVCVLQNAPMPALRGTGLTIEPLDVPIEATRFDLELHLTEDAGQIAGTLIYNTVLFEKPTVQQLADAYRTLVASAVSRSKQAVSRLRLLTADHATHAVRLLTRPQNTDSHALPSSSAHAAAHDEAATLHEAFLRAAHQHPGATAVAFGDQTLSYAEVERRAGALASRLRAEGVGPETLVGLCLERSDDLVIALLAILMAGGAYVPLDPDYPDERLSFIAADAGVIFAVASYDTAARLVRAGVRIMLLSDLDAEDAAPTWRPPAGPSGDQAAYVIYTSGSTGQPKGTVVTHANVLRLFTSTRDWFAFATTDVWTLFHSCAFDFSVWELWGALLHGGTLVVVPGAVARSPQAFHDLLLTRGVTVLNQTPWAFYQLMAAIEAGDLPALPTLRLVIFGGESLDVSRLDAWFARYPDTRPRLVNMYGITETTVHVTYASVRAGSHTADAADVAVRRGMYSPIGRPIPDLDVYLLGPHQEPVPPGMPGEIYVGGAGVARGYLRRPSLTAARFLPNPFAETPGERLYRSGDLARLRPDGSLEFVGRADQQVKVRGYRVELPEIEAHLRAYLAIRDAAVVTRDRSNAGRDLLAYVVPRAASAEEDAEIDQALVREWQAVFEQIYRREAGDHAPTFNIAGWVDSKTGRPIPAAEMQEWVDATVRKIADLRPTRLLEIGCGTGLLMHRLAPMCEQYIGTDASASVLELLASHVTHLPHVSLHHRAAHELDDVPAASMDTVVLNSVVQYFPGVDYLARVLTAACRTLAPGGTLFIGDLRHFDLLETFHARRLAEREHAPSPEPLRRRVRQAMAAEEELVLTPALFVPLAERLDGVEQVEVYVKRGRAHNELTRYRYDVILRLAPLGDPKTMFEADWHWTDAALSVDNLASRLACVSSARIRRVPNARLAGDAAVRRWLEPMRSHAPLARVIESNDVTGVDPETVCKIGEQLGFTTAVTYADGDPLAVDILLARGADRIIAPFTSHPPTDRPLTTNPRAAWRARQLPFALRAHLRERVPEYMMPAQFVCLDALPLTAHGKLDRHALPEPLEAHVNAAGYVPPSTPAEQVVTRIWSELLALERIGLDDRFVDLGGHSLLAVQAVARLSAAFQVEVPLQVILDNPTVQTVVSRLADLWGGRDVLEEVARTLLEILSAEQAGAAQAEAVTREARR